MRGAYEAAATAGRRYSAMRQMAEPAAFEALYGADGAWLALHGACFASRPLSEKQVKRGTSNVLPRACRAVTS